MCCVTWQHNISYRWSIACEAHFKWFHFRWLLHQKEQYVSVAHSPWQRYTGNINVASMLITSCHRRSGIQSWDIAFLSSTKFHTACTAVNTVLFCQLSLLFSTPVSFLALFSTALQKFPTFCCDAYCFSCICTFEPTPRTVVLIARPTLI